MRTPFEYPTTLSDFHWLFSDEFSPDEFSLPPFTPRVLNYEKLSHQPHKSHYSEHWSTSERSASYVEPDIPVFRRPTPSPVFLPPSPVFRPLSPVFALRSPLFRPSSPVFRPASPIYDPPSPVLESSSFALIKCSSPVYERPSPVYKPSSPIFEPQSAPTQTWVTFRSQPIPEISMGSFVRPVLPLRTGLKRQSDLAYNDYPQRQKQLRLSELNTISHSNNNDSSPILTASETSPSDCFCGPDTTSNPSCAGQTAEIASLEAQVETLESKNALQSAELAESKFCIKFLVNQITEVIESSHHRETSEKLHHTIRTTEYQLKSLIHNSALMSQITTSPVAPEPSGSIYVDVNAQRPLAGLVIGASTSRTTFDDTVLVNPYNSALCCMSPINSAHHAHRHFPMVEVQDLSRYAGSSHVNSDHDILSNRLPPLNYPSLDRSSGSNYHYHHLDHLHPDSHFRPPQLEPSPVFLNALNESYIPLTQDYPLTANIYI